VGLAGSRHPALAQAAVTGHRRKQLAELGKPLTGLLAAADGTPLADEIVTVLREHGDDVLACLLPMLRAAGPKTKRSPRGAGTGLRAAAHRDHRTPGPGR
jgi:hypothetical protein